ncbi:phosphoesterase family-domain-containing protein [Globomyces pollinis-pini]|nr:phosphoesterase family-domain-containing protein [Globomyces pollinis-pini]
MVGNEWNCNGRNEVTALKVLELQLYGSVLEAKSSALVTSELIDNYILNISNTPTSLQKRAEASLNYSLGINYDTLNRRVIEPKINLANGPRMNIDCVDCYTNGDATVTIEIHGNLVGVKAYKVSLLGTLNGNVNVTYTMEEIDQDMHVRKTLASIPLNAVTVPAIFSFTPSFDVDSGIAYKAVSKTNLDLAYSLEVPFSYVISSNDGIFAKPTLASTTEAIFNPQIKSKTTEDINTDIAAHLIPMFRFKFALFAALKFQFNLELDNALSKNIQSGILSECKVENQLKTSLSRKSDINFEIISLLISKKYTLKSFSAPISCPFCDKCVQFDRPTPTTTATPTTTPVDTLPPVIELKDTDPVNPAIKNIVVLMLENRSFDSFLGRLKLDGINPNVNGLTGNEVNYSTNGTAIRVRPYDKLSSKVDPGHELWEVTEQLYGEQGPTEGKKPNMGGFASDAEKVAVKLKLPVDEALSEVMGAHGKPTLPITYKLAQEFSIIDEWYSSVPGPTQPNRHFLHCATSKGMTKNSNLPVIPLDCKTNFENLQENGKTWGSYYDGVAPLTILYAGLRDPKNLEKIKSFPQFKLDARNGNLPQFTFLEPDYQKNDNHPPNNLNDGELFVKEVYESLRASPQWNQTLFMITYDEHGGFYDHVTPPENIPAPDNFPIKPASGDFKFDRLGVRVPTLLISPWVPKGKIFRSGVKGRYLEHSSVSATLNKWAGTPFLTKRDAWAVPFQGVANHLKEPRQDCVKRL